MRITDYSQDRGMSMHGSRCKGWDMTSINCASYQPVTVCTQGRARQPGKARATDGLSFIGSSLLSGHMKIARSYYLLPSIFGGGFYLHHYIFPRIHFQFILFWFGHLKVLFWLVIGVYNESELPFFRIPYLEQWLKNQRQLTTWVNWALAGLSLVLSKVRFRM